VSPRWQGSDGHAASAGSHNTFQAEDGRIVVISDHGHTNIVRPLLRKIIRDMGLTLEDYNRLIEKL
jgi:predicted RNA binding protein YcfA (HicA-like mRNA interferase family)